MSGPDPEAAALAGIRAAYATWFAAMESGDVALGLSVVTDDVVQQGPVGPERVGREALGAVLRAFHDAYVERVQWELDAVTVVGGRARVRVRETATVRPRDGGPSFRLRGLHDAELVRDAAGAWRIARDVGTLDGGPAPVEHAFELPGG